MISSPTNLSLCCRVRRSFTALWRRADARHGLGFVPARALFRDRTFRTGAGSASARTSRATVARRRAIFLAQRTARRRRAIGCKSSASDAPHIFGLLGNPYAPRWALGAAVHVHRAWRVQRASAGCSIRLKLAGVFTPRSGSIGTFGVRSCSKAARRGLGHASRFLARHRRRRAVPLSGRPWRTRASAWRSARAAPIR